MTNLLVIGLAFLGNALIYAGFALINARLLPSALAPFYGATSPLARTIAMEVMFAVPANYLFAVAFRVTTPVHASVAILGTLVLVMAANAVLLGAQMTPRLALALAVTLCACLWLAYEQSSLIAPVD